MNRAKYNEHKVLGLRQVTNSVFVLRFDRKDLHFVAGEHLNVGPKGIGYTREYSIYSGENDDFIEILIKEVPPPDGFISPLLSKLVTNDIVNVEEPIGYLRLNEIDKKYLFVATGTGISPYHSIISTNPNLDYYLIHGISEASDAVDIEFYDRERVLLCTSQKDDGDYFGRVTSWLEITNLDEFDYIYLCGNRNMINDAFAILANRGFDSSKIKAEAYF